MRKEASSIFFKKLAIAESFCNGSREKAKRLINGEFKDIVVIKGRFNDETEDIYGFFLSFFSRVFYSVFINYIALTNYTVALQNKPINDWMTFYSKMENAFKEADYDHEKGIEYNGKMKEIMDMKNVIGILEWVDINDIKSLTRRFEKIIAEALGRKVKVDLDYEETNSLILNEKWGLKPPK